MPILSIRPYHNITKKFVLIMILWKICIFVLIITLEFVLIIKRPPTHQFKNCSNPISQCEHCSSFNHTSLCCKTERMPHWSSHVCSLTPRIKRGGEVNRSSFKLIDMKTIPHLVLRNHWKKTSTIHSVNWNLHFHLPLQFYQKNP